MEIWSVEGVPGAHLHRQFHQDDLAKCLDTQKVKNMGKNSVVWWDQATTVQEPHRYWRKDYSGTLFDWITVQIMLRLAVQFCLVSMFWWRKGNAVSNLILKVRGEICLWYTCSPHKYLVCLMPVNKNLRGIKEENQKRKICGGSFVARHVCQENVSGLALFLDLGQKLNSCPSPAQFPLERTCFSEKVPWVKSKRRGLLPVPTFLHARCCNKTKNALVDLWQAKLSKSLV